MVLMRFLNWLYYRLPFCALAAVICVSLITGCQNSEEMKKAAKIAHEIRVKHELERVKRKRTPTPVPTNTPSVTVTFVLPIPLVDPQPQLKDQNGDQPEKVKTEEPVEEELFTADDVAFLNQEDSVEAADLSGGEQEGSSLIGGVVTREEIALEPEEVVEDDSAEPEEEQESSDTFERLGGQPRGYMMLYLMHPKARPTVERQVWALLKAEINDIFLGVLSDGTFSVDFAYLASVLQRLTTAGRAVTLVVYLTNGPAMREYDSTPLHVEFCRIEPEEFRYLIQHDRETRERFVEMVRKVQPVFQLNRRLGPRNRNIAVVMLEDNLDRDSYRSMRTLARSVLGAGVEFVRNPCPGCYSGNDVDASGDGIELHAVGDVMTLRNIDAFTLDGVGYAFPGEEPAGRLSVEEVMRLSLIAARRQLRYFGLWRAARQGLSTGMREHPDDRVYEVPMEAQLEIEIQLLRQGLKAVEFKPAQ